MSLVIKYPVVTEKAMDKMDFENKMVFVVAGDATKPETAEAIGDRYDVTVTSVNTQITTDGKKKATVELSDGDDATAVASRIGVF